MLSQLACVLPVYSTILISFHASRAFLSCWSTTGLRICDTEQGGREREKRKWEEKNSIQLQNLLHDSASKRLESF